MLISPVLGVSSPSCGNCDIPEVRKGSRLSELSLVRSPSTDLLLPSWPLVSLSMSKAILSAHGTLVWKENIIMLAYLIWVCCWQNRSCSSQSSELAKAVCSVRGLCQCLPPVAVWYHNSLWSHLMMWWGWHYRQKSELLRVALHGARQKGAQLRALEGTLVNSQSVFLKDIWVLFDWES